MAEPIYHTPQQATITLSGRDDRLGLHGNATVVTLLTLL